MNKRVIFSSNGELKDCSAIFDEYAQKSKVVSIDVGDSLFIGSRLPFNHLFVKLKELNTLPSDMDVKYWDGADWASVVELLDETSGFTQDGFITFTPNRDHFWQIADTTKRVEGLEGVTIYDLFWVKISFSAALDATTELQWLGNLFSDDYDLAGEFPDLVRPAVKSAFRASKTDWQEQHIIAANLLIDDLVNKAVIDDASQVLVRGDYRGAAVMKTAEIIFNSLGDDYVDNKIAARREYESRLGKRIHKVDSNKNAIEDRHERVQQTGWLSR